MANLTYAEKVKKAKEESKKRFEAKQARNKKTIGIEDDIIKTRAKKSKSSKLGSAQKSSGSKNPTSVFQDMKTKKKDTTKKKSDGRSFLQKYILGEKFQPKANTNKSPGALGGKLNEKTTTKPKKDDKKVVSTTKKDNTKKSSTTEKYSSFGAAFKAARAKGIGTPFTYKGKKFTAVRDTDIPKSIKGTASERLKKFLNQKRKK
jgi:hypothetical protein